MILPPVDPHLLDGLIEAYRVPKRQPGRPQLTERDQRVYAYKKAGWTLKAIAEAEGISRNRAYQINRKVRSILEGEPGLGKNAELFIEELERQDREYRFREADWKRRAILKKREPVPRPAPTSRAVDIPCIRQVSPETQLRVHLLLKRLLLHI